MSDSYPVEIVMDGFKEDAAQHGAGLAALIPVLVDESAELAHSGAQILIQLEICWDLDCHLVCLQMQYGPVTPSHTINGMPNTKLAADTVHDDVLAARQGTRYFNMKMTAGRQ